MKKTADNFCLLDSNALIYAMEKGSSRYEETRHFLERLSKNGYGFCITEQIVREVLVVFTQPRFVKKPLNPNQAKQLGMQLLYQFVFLPSNNYSRLFLLESVEKYSLAGRKIHDANIVAVMRAHGVKKIFTFNQKDFSNFEAIEILKP